MNPTDNNNLPTIDDELFDVLADGELSEAQRRDLLAKLDHVPDGWRRCALAFLEAQCWKEEFSRIPHEPIVETQQPAARPFGGGLFQSPPDGMPGLRPTSKQVLTGVPWSTWVAVAASFLIAFGLGAFLRDFFYPAGQSGPAPIQMAESSETQRQAHVRPDESKVISPDSFRQSGHDATPWKMVTLTVNDGSEDGLEPIRLPAIERESINQAWLESLPAAMPADVLRAWRETGHQVRQHRTLLPIPMNDGRHLVVPVDQVELRYVGNRAYQ